MMTVVGWLLVRHKKKPYVALPVPRQAFMGLTRAVSYSLQTITEEHSRPQKDRFTSGAWRDRCWHLAAADPAVAIWLAAEETQSPEPGVVDDDFSAARAAILWLECLEESLITSATPQGAALLKQSILVSMQELYVATGMRSSGSDAIETRSSVAHSTAVRWRDQILSKVSARPPDGKEISEHEVASILSLGQGDSQVGVLHELLVASKSLRAIFLDFSGSVSSARLEAIRELAYGAGHEINNPLANIAARAQALLYDEHEPERQRRLATIVDQAFRARDMIGGLMIFARPPKPHQDEVSIRDVLQSVFSSMESMAEERGVRLTLHVVSETMCILVDRGQIEDSLRGILSNAIEAIFHGGTVSVKAIESTSEACLVTVNDNGIGMDMETMSRAFDPFFSGREAGRGIGLGLSKAFRLIDANGGSISIKSRLQQGTEVSISLPRVSRSA
jgi:signal transduction histidine kinase